ncbi:MAG: nucleotide sugar dehydrogenase, partial [Verrucomicrobia bacterium]|nr:nucleotide sugar dehydrogenase [Verrucomicrobiota bacterium]
GHIFQFLTPTVLRVSDIETAEMIKLIDNTKRDVIFGFSNEVARLCDASGLSAEEVISVGRFGYSRTDLPSPGPVGGPCLSKDSHILAQSVSAFGIVPEITLAARRVNETQPHEVVRFLKNLIQQNPQFPSKIKISLLGIAFKGKPATDDIRGTTAKPILEEFKKSFPMAEFFGFDPVVDPDAIQGFGLHPKTDAREVIVQSHLSLILNNHPFFASLPLEQWSKEMKGPSIIYDFWNNFGRNLSLAPDIYYIALGSHKFAKEIV